ncbi:hypothetical protein D3C81_1796460 [compost metagenome]
MHIFIQTDIRKAQPAGGFVDFGVDHIEILVRQRILNRSDILQHLLQFLRRHLAHSAVHVVHLLFHIEQILKGPAQNIADRLSLRQHCVLVQIACPHAFRPFNFTFVRLKLACNDVHEGGFTFTVGTDQTDMFALQQAEGYIGENRTVSKPVTQLFYV